MNSSYQFIRQIHKKLSVFDNNLAKSYKRKHFFLKFYRIVERKKEKKFWIIRALEMKKQMFQNKLHKL